MFHKFPTQVTYKIFKKIGFAFDEIRDFIKTNEQANRNV